MIRRIAIACMMVAAYAAAGAQMFDKQLTPAQKLSMAEAIISNLYVDEVNSDSIVQEGIIAMLKTLDPHSKYSTPEETKELNEPLEGKFSGIGIQFNMSTDTVYVIQTISGGPCEKVGVRPGDRIIWAGDSLLAGRKLPNSRIVKILRGPKGSKVTLKVARSGQPELLEFNVTRDDIPINSVEDAYMATPEIGYVRLTRFAESSPKEIEDAIRKLQAQGMRKLIIDLQGNGGGYLGAAVEIAELFLDKGSPIVYTQGRDGERQYFNADRSKPLFTGDVAVLIDQYSASASEILSGALQDNDRGIVVGRRSFGKGLVQRPFPFPDGSMIRLTVSRYYTPAGRCIQKHYDKGHSEEYQLDALNRYSSGELFSADSIKFDESQKYTTLKKGRTVYGGGGIMPDIFVPLDTTLYTKYYRELMAKSVIARYSINYVDQHRAEILAKYPTEDSFYGGFVVAPQIIDGLVEDGKAEGVELNQEELDTSLPLLRAIITGLLARDLYQDGNYSRAINPLNPIFNEAIKALE